MNDQLFQLQEWTPELVITAQEIMNTIREVVPELKVVFKGAAALKLPGKNDIDLDILCPANSIESTTKRLTTVLGRPNHVDTLMTTWDFMKDGFEIDCVLSDPHTSLMQKQKRTFELLKASAELRHEYEQLKRSADGLPYAEYEKRKQAFFKKLLAHPA